MRRARRVAAGGAPVVEAVRARRARPTTVAGPSCRRRPRRCGRFTRGVDTGWRRTSYTGLIRGRADAGGPPASAASPRSRAPRRGRRPTSSPMPATPSRPPTPAAAVPSPMATLPAGATFGTLVHAVLEHADPGAADLPRRAAPPQVDEQRRCWPVEVDRRGARRRPCCGAAHAARPAGRRPHAARDRARRPAARARLRAAAGRRRRAPTAPTCRSAELAPLLRAHLPTDDPLRAYADRSSPALGGQQLRGYLTGSIDAVLRVGRGPPRFLVVDYKTNQLGDVDEPLTASTTARTA